MNHPAAINSSTNLPPKLLWLLVEKDWHFMRWPIALYLWAGCMALVMLAAQSEAAFYAGAILLITILMSISIHLPMLTVITERTEKTLAFIMSLPITAKDYTIAKVISNASIFFVPWLLILLATLLVLAKVPTLPDGLIPFALIIFMQIWVNAMFILSAALITESQSWAIVTIVATNLIFQGVMYGASHAAGIAAHMKGAVVVWSADALLILLAQSLAIVLSMLLTFWAQSRKTDFVV